ncbi:MAG: DUF4198 domain-containing protein [Deltaproteobacteria bacterium]|nr:DUF4198 domain-containing protein [Deltaproteobacteria bacterium]
MKKNVFKLSLIILWAFACLFAHSGLVEAHDLWLNIDNHYTEAGVETNAKVVFGHNFPYYDILISSEDLSEFCYLSPLGKKTKIAKTWKEIKGESYGQPAGARVGKVSLDQKGTYLVVASRKRKGDKEHVPSEKYAKSIITVGQGSDNVSQTFGHRIEIVPLKNPSEVKAGESLPVKILFEGKPLSTYVYATYAGYYSEDEPFPVFTKSNEKGVAYVKISKPGIWMVVSNHKVDFSASLTFEIK